MSTVSERIFQVVDAADVPPRSRRSTLAKLCGISPQAVRDWEEGKTKNIKHENLVAIAKHFRVSLTWLLTGKGDMKTAWQKGEVENVIEFQRSPADVPLISAIQAGSWGEVIDIREPGFAEQYLPCVAPHSSSAFALRVDGDSMTSPTGRSYPHGTIIFVDPEQRGGVIPGDRVVAKLNGDETVTFKQLAEDRQGLFLKALNPNHEPIYAEFRILGKVIGSWLPE